MNNRTYGNVSVIRDVECNATRITLKPEEVARKFVALANNIIMEFNDKDELVSIEITPSYKE